MSVSRSQGDVPQGRELRLPHVISGSGARYSDGKTTFWNRGKSVLMQVDDKIVVQDSCCSKSCRVDLFAVRGG